MSLNDVGRQVNLWTRIRRFMFAFNIVLLVFAIAVDGWALIGVIITVPIYVIAQRVAESWLDEFEVHIAEMDEK